MSAHIQGEAGGPGEVYVQPLNTDIKNIRDLDTLRVRHEEAEKAWDAALIEDCYGPEAAAKGAEVKTILGRMYELEHPTAQGYKPIELGHGRRSRESFKEEVSLVDFWKKALSGARSQLFSASIVSAFAAAKRKRRRQGE